MKEEIEEQLKQEQHAHLMTRFAWDRTCEERDKLKLALEESENQVKILGAMNRGLTTSLKECQSLLNSDKNVQGSVTTEAEQTDSPLAPNLDNFKEQLEESALNRYGNPKGKTNQQTKAFENGGRWAEQFFIPIIEKLKEENEKLQQEKENQAISEERFKPMDSALSSLYIAKPSEAVKDVIRVWLDFKKIYNYK